MVIAVMKLTIHKNKLKMETVRDFIFLGSRITADGNCSHEIKRQTPWKKSYDQPIHARGEGERVLALESREGTRAS